VPTMIIIELCMSRL